MTTPQTSLLNLPEITVENVRAALDELLYCSTARSMNPLQYLLLVEQALTNPDLPSSPLIRKFALNHILNSIITNKFIQHRRVLEMTIPEQEDAISTVKVAIASDLWTENPELIGWSWLYYRYVRVDLDISLTHFSCLASVHERTFRRYQHHALWRLTEELVEQEWAVRRQFRTHLLYSALLRLVPAHLFGREDTPIQANDLLQVSLQATLPINRDS